MVTATRVISLSLGFALAGSVINISHSQPYVYHGSPNCPWYNLGHTWKDYFMGKYGDQPYVRFTVLFDHLTHNIGTIHAGSRFTMTRGGGVWTASGTNVFGEFKTVGYSNGDPAKYQLSVWGALLNYNEAGQIFLNKELVGTLKCGIGSGA